MTFNSDKLKHPITGTIKTRGEWVEALMAVCSCEDTVQELISTFEKV